MRSRAWLTLGRNVDGLGLCVRRLKILAWFYWTIGSRCEDCAPGFFGNPSDVGGACRPCHCHHNIDTTDPDACDKETGRCLRCLYHTEGEHCQRCRFGYYGDALQQDCRSKMRVPCACSLGGFPLSSSRGIPFFWYFFPLGIHLSLVQRGKIPLGKKKNATHLFFFSFFSLYPHFLAELKFQGMTQYLRETIKRKNCVAGPCHPIKCIDFIQVLPRKLWLARTWRSSMPCLVHALSATDGQSLLG